MREVFFVIKKVEIAHMLLVVLRIKKIFYEKELQKTNQTEFRVEKAIKKKDDKLYV